MPGFAFGYAVTFFFETEFRRKMVDANAKNSNQRRHAD